MNNSRNIFGFVTHVFACILPATAMAENTLQVGGSVGIQTRNLEYQFLGIKIKPTFQTVAYSLAATHGRMFANLELEAMIEGDTQYIRDVVNNRTTTIESKRSDSAATLGYNLWRGLSVFAGYKLGETESNLSPADGGVLKFIFSQKGPFAGVAYGQSIGSKGSIAISTAYASLRGEADVQFIGTGSSFITGGTTSGLSYGISWTGVLSERAYYRLSLKTNSYKFKDKDLGFEGKDLSTDEDYRIFGLAVGTSF